VNAGVSQGISNVCRTSNLSTPQLPPRAIKKVGCAAVEPFCDILNNGSPKSCTRRFSRSSVESNRVLREIASPSSINLRIKSLMILKTIQGL
jgi:mitogen-activated protein kinase kinase kinase ANP1